MIGTEELVEKTLRQWGRGRIFFARDLDIGESAESIRQALSSLTEKKVILRMARGIYCYPRVTGEFGIHVVYPSDEEVAEAVAIRDGVRIIPFGDKAASLLGLSGRHVGGLRYRTDGSSRTIRLSSSRTIIFKHTSEMKMFAFRNESMQLLSSAIRDFGEEYVCSPERERIVRQIITKVPVGDFQHDVMLPPVWVADILKRLYGGIE
jgi:hypothetical protein